MSSVNDYMVSSTVIIRSDVSEKHVMHFPMDIPR